jgi:hypothetical protein
MAVTTSRLHFQATRDNSGINLCVEIGNEAVINLSLSRKEIERMLEAISIALDENNEGEDVAPSG